MTPQSVKVIHKQMKIRLILKEELVQICIAKTYNIDTHFLELICLLKVIACMPLFKWRQDLLLFFFSYSLSSELRVCCCLLPAFTCIFPLSNTYLVCCFHVPHAHYE